MEGNDVQSDVLQRALARRFSLLEKTRIHRIAEKCFQSKSNVPPVRERRFIVKGGNDDIEREVNLITEKDHISEMEAWHRGAAAIARIQQTRESLVCRDAHPFKVAVDKVTYHPIDPEVITNYNNWLAQRKLLRKDLNHLGNYTSWIKGKRNPTALETRVLQAELLKQNEMNSDCTDSLPSTPDFQEPRVQKEPQAPKDSSLADSDVDRTRSVSLTPPVVSDAMRILQEYVDSRRLRLHDLFTQLDRNKSWSLDKPDLTKMGLSARQIEEILGPLDCLTYKAVKQASEALKSEQRLVKKCLRPPLPPIRDVNKDADENETQVKEETRVQKVMRAAPGGYAQEAPKTASDESRNSSFSPLEWAQYSHRLVPSLQSNVRDQILAFRDETWNEYQNLLAKCTKEGLSLSVVSLAKGLLAPGDRRWEECTKHLRQMTGLQMVKSHKPDAGYGVQDNQLSTEDTDKAETKVSKFYDSTQQYRDIATKNPGEKLKLSTGVAVVRPRTDCWMSYEEYLALTSKVRTKFRWVYTNNEPWCGHLLDKMRLCMPMQISKNQAASIFCFTADVGGRASARRASGYSTNDAGYHQSSTRVRQALL